MRDQQFEHVTSKAWAIAAVAVMLVGHCWAASNIKLVYSFTGGNDGGDPATALTFDQSGNAYGTTVTGGDFGCGTVFQLTPSGGHFTESVLFSFDCFDSGKNPYGGVILDSKGNLYGTTVAGGSGGICAGDGCGLVYMLSNVGGTWQETPMYNFTGGDDGFGPGGALISDGNSNFYGTTPDGGADGVGVVYQISPVRGGGWKQTVIHTFTGGDDGAVGSLGSLLMDKAGNLYGVTELGGASGAGTAFRMSPAQGGWTMTSLYAFKGQPDAAFPYGGLTADASGNLFGTTYFGGQNGAGAVFKLARTGKKEVVLYSFKGGTDGSNPTSTLVFDAAGNLYGTTSTGGNPGCDCGTVFELSPSHGERILHRFGETPDGGYPYYGLTPDPNGDLYGTTASGGSNTQGVVFKFTP